MTEKINNSEIKRRKVEYSVMLDEQNYVNAYNEIKSNTGNMTPGADGETIDGFGRDTIKKIIEKMKNRSFQFKPTKRIFIPKANGKQRPLGIPSPKDKIVQKVYLDRLEE